MDTGIPAGDETGATRDRSRPTTLGRGPRTLVVAGDDAGPAARILAERAGWPLLAEPTSGARAGANAVRTARLLLGTSLRAGVERVVVVGHPTLSRPVTALISDPELEILAVRTRVGVATDPGRVAQVLDQVPRVDGDPEPDEERWLGRWRAADRALSAAIDAQVRSWQQDLPPGELHPLAVAAEIGAAVTPRATLVVGSSNPIRGAALPMGFNRTPLYADGLLLVGDAGGMVNPFNGEGIDYALEAARVGADIIAQALSRSTDPARERVLASYPKVMKAELGGYFTLGRWFAHAIGNPEVMRLATKYGLPRTTLMRFLLKIMANLPEARGGRVDDRIIHALSSLAPDA